MLYSMGVRLTGSPSTVTVLVSSSRAMPPMTIRLGFCSMPPREVYRRSWDRTRARTSMGLKGLVM